MFVFLLIVIFFNFVSADVVSINSGGNRELIINPELYLEGFFFQENDAPVMSNVLLFSQPYSTNTTNENLSVSYSSTDADKDSLTNISDWRVGGVSIAVLNMPFDTKENRTTTGAIRDYSIYQNNGTLGGGTESAKPLWNSSCKIGGCYIYDGINDYISLRQNYVFTNNNTISFWAKIGATDYQGIVGGALGNYAYIIFGQTTSAGYTYRDVIFGETNTDSDFIQLFFTNPDPISTDTWYHFVITENSTNGWKLYINGVFQSEDITTNPNMTIRRIGEGRLNVDKFNGSLDEIKIFNRVLTDEQILADYYFGLAGKSTEKIVSQENEIGDVWTVAMTANDAWFDSTTVLSNNLTIVNSPPINPNPKLVSQNGRNETTADLNCSFIVSDTDSFTLNVTVNWLKNNVSQYNFTYNNIANATFYSSILNKSNLTLGDVWKCSVRYYDGDLYSSWRESNTLQIIDITSPNITILSPLSTANYTDLNVTFNITGNENLSSCVYRLDFNSNVSMIKLNDTYFWILDNTFGPGNHNVTFYCNDTSNNWGMNFTNFTIENEAAISILLSPLLMWSVHWNVTNLPADDLNADGNNLGNATSYYLNISATNTLVDLYVKADGDLHTIGLEILNLSNENYTISLTDPNVTGVSKATMTTNYALIADGIGDASVVYMKFYLDAPSAQGAGEYFNNLDFKAVRHGQAP